MKNFPKVILTNPNIKNDKLRLNLSNEGIPFINMPLIKTQRTSTLPIPFTSSIFDIIVFTSKNGIKYLPKKYLKEIKGKTIICIGPTTKEAAENKGLTVHSIPKLSSTPGLISHLKKFPKKSHLLLFQGEKAPKELHQKLKKIFSKVQRINLYKTLDIEIVPPIAKKLILSDKYGIIIFTSPSTVQSFVNIMQQNKVTLFTHLRVASFGPSITQELKKVGFSPLIKLKNPDVPDFAQKIKKYISTYE